jgi:ABC-type nitrate/sulfonate/bicarbonate transport system substrate-binding protein
MIGRHNVQGARIVEVPIGSEAALLERGAADVVMMLEPAASRAVQEGFQIVTSFPQLWGPFAFTGLTSTSTFVNENREVVTRVRAAMQDALNFAHGNPNGAIATAAELFPTLGRNVVAAAVQRMLSDQTIPRQFAVSPEGWAAAVRVRQAMGELQGGDYRSVIA